MLYIQPQNQLSIMFHPQPHYQMNKYKQQQS